jgi:hypothetical protein
MFKLINVHNMADRQIINKPYEKKIFKKCSGIELLINVMPDDGLIRPKRVATILIF